MKERLEKLLEASTKRREELLNAYLSAMEKPDWDNNTSMEAVNAAGRLHDIDRHITNLQLELKRLEVPHAS